MRLKDVVLRDWDVQLFALPVRERRLIFVSAETIHNVSVSAGQLQPRLSLRFERVTVRRAHRRLEVHFLHTST